jgi:hypothetical protein
MVVRREFQSPGNLVGLERPPKRTIEDLSDLIQCGQGAWVQLGSDSYRACSGVKEHGF